MKKLYVYKDGRSIVEEDSRSDGVVSFHALGGGFSRRLPEHTFDQDFKATELPEVLYPFKFSGDWLEAEYIGYTDGNRWNGWAMPLVTKETFEALIAIMGPENATVGEDGYKFRWDGDVMYFYDPQEEREFAISPEKRATTDGEKLLYDISLGWCWDFVGTL